MGRGDVTVPVVEGWTALAMAAGGTSRISLGSFVLNVVNRHPAVVARMASTLQIASGGRLVVGDRASAGTRRSTRRTASSSRRRPSASPGSRRPSRSSARCGPAARSPASRRTTRWSRRTPGRCRIRRRRSSSVARQPAGARLAARSATAGPRSRTGSGGPARLPEALEAAGKRREDQTLYVGFQGEWLSDETLDDSPWVLEPRETWDGGGRPAPIARSCSRDDGRRGPAGGRRRALVGRGRGPVTAQPREPGQISIRELLGAQGT